MISLILACSVATGLHKIKNESEKKISKILVDVWVIKFVEPVKVEI